MARADNPTHNGAVLWAHQTNDELRSAFDGGAVGLWAVGASEQHGRHLVTGFDHLAAEAVVHAAAGRLGAEALVLPTLCIGCSTHWVELGGTLSIGLDTMRRIMIDVCESAGRAGLRNLVIVNGHAGNAAIGIAAVQEFGAGDLVVEFVSYWDMLDRERLLDLQDLEDGCGHAGELETSIGLALGELMVREPLIPGDVRVLDPGAPGGGRVVFHRAARAGEDAQDGVIGDAAAGTATLGEAALEMAVEGLVAHCRELRARRLAVDGGRVG